MMMNSDIYSTVLSGHKMVSSSATMANRLQNFKGVPAFNNLLTDCRVENRGDPPHVDFAKHTEAMGALARHCHSLAELKSALEWARTTDRTSVISIATNAFKWVPGDADWDVGVPEVSAREAVQQARAHQLKIRSKQRVGV